jgi:hypothetical protein
MPEVQRTDLTLNDGTQVWLKTCTGIVESVKDWSETHVSSSGGGGYLQGGTGTVSAPTVRSTSIHRQVFFLKYEDGTQEEFNTPLISVAVGHKVTGVWGAKQGNDTGHYLGYYDHTTNKYGFYDEYDYRDFGQKKLRNQGCLSLAVYLVLFFSVFIWGANHGMAGAYGDPAATSATEKTIFRWLVLSASFAAYAYQRSKKRKRFKSFYEDLKSKALALMREQ